MQTKAKKRQVIYTIESLEHFQEKISAENKKLICKYLSTQLTLTGCRYRDALGMVRSLRPHGAKLQISLHEV